MKWDRGHQSPDLIDQRGRGGGGMLGGGMLGPLLSLGSRFGIGGIVVVLGLYFGAQALMGGTESARLSDGETGQGQVAPDERKEFVAAVLDDVQGTWSGIFSQLGKPYQRAKLVLFTDQTSTACGYGSAAMGPFYCPGDQRVFIDLGFFQQLDRKLGAPGDFAQAYVIAHEIGHHVQRILGVDRDDRSKGAEGGSVRLELQADCFAGVWAHSAQQRNVLEVGDIEEALQAAAAVGDDALQRGSTGAVNPEKWTHGSSKARASWFRRGLQEGSVEACDTQAAQQL
jgi:predicted metalloprotease